MFGQRLKELRISNSMTQLDLGNKLGISSSAVGMYEQGNREPDNHMLIKICNIFDVPADYLLNPYLKNYVYLNQDDKHNLEDIMNSFFKELLKQKNIFYNNQQLKDKDIENIVNKFKDDLNLLLN